MPARKLPVKERPVWRVWLGPGGNEKLRLKYQNVTHTQAWLLVKRFRKAGLDAFVGRDWSK